jgi:hypothetical protein
VDADEEDRPNRSDNPGVIAVTEFSDQAKAEIIVVAVPCGVCVVRVVVMD